MTERQHMLQIKTAFESAGHKFEIMYDSGKVKYNSQKFDAILALRGHAGFCFIEAKMNNKTLTDAQYMFQVDCFRKGIPFYVLRIDNISYGIYELLGNGFEHHIDYCLDLTKLVELFVKLCTFKDIELA